MKKIKLFALAFTFMSGSMFISCSDSDDNDPPAYEQVVINHAASAGLNGKVKSVETISYVSEWDEERSTVKKENATERNKTAYDSKGHKLGYEKYVVENIEGAETQFKLDWREESQYDDRYRQIFGLYESRYVSTGKLFYGWKVEITYNDKNQTATVVEYMQEQEGYVLHSSKIYALKPNGTVDRSVFTSFEKSMAKSIQDNNLPTQKRVVLKEDGKNWTESYIHRDYSTENGSKVSVGAYQERTIVYH